MRRIVESYASGYSVSPVAAVCSVSRIAKAAHQLHPYAGDPFRVIASFPWLARKAETWHRGDDNIKTVFDATTIRNRIGERTDDFFVLDDRAGPPVKQQYRHRARILRPLMDEMNIDA